LRIWDKVIVHCAAKVSVTMILRVIYFKVDAGDRSKEFENKNVKILVQLNQEKKSLNGAFDFTYWSYLRFPYIISCCLTKLKRKKKHPRKKKGFAAYFADQNLVAKKRSSLKNFVGSSSLSCQNQRCSLFGLFLNFWLPSLREKRGVLQILCWV